MSNEDMNPSGGDSVQAAPSNCGKSADKPPTEYVQGQDFLCAT